MTYRSLLVHLDGSSSCATRVAFAIRLAEDLDCHLVGLAATGRVGLPAAADPEAAAMLAQYAELAWDAMRLEADAAALGFQQACKAARLRSFECVVDHDHKAASLVRHLHCSDLAVMTQADPDSNGSRDERLLIEDVILRGARPTLVLPRAGDFGTPSKVLVAWDDSREAARAISDALPFLRRAARVDVVAWKEAADDAAALALRLEALRHWLLWQGVTASTRVEVSDSSVGAAIRSRATDADADLIVMGAYGHARWSERVLGGATRALLESTTVPVLMSH